jgi:C4-type Zn-finger protein
VTSIYLTEVTNFPSCPECGATPTEGWADVDTPNSSVVHEGKLISGTLVCFKCYNCGYSVCSQIIQETP